MRNEINTSSENTYLIRYWKSKTRGESKIRKTIETKMLKTVEQQLLLEFRETNVDYYHLMSVFFRFINNLSSEQIREFWNLPWMNICFVFTKNRFNESSPVIPTVITDRHAAIIHLFGNILTCDFEAAVKHLTAAVYSVLKYYSQEHKS